MEHPLRQYRERHGLSQETLASVIGTTKATVSRLEGGERAPSLEMMRKIAEATRGEVTANDFLPMPDEARA